ncbi:hypothetical protein MHYP_G00128010 [Metynnis hypsauchen]
MVIVAPWSEAGRHEAARQKERKSMSKQGKKRVRTKTQRTHVRIPCHGNDEVPVTLGANALTTETTDTLDSTKHPKTRPRQLTVTCQAQEQEDPPDHLSRRGQ